MSGSKASCFRTGSGHLAVRERCQNQRILLTKAPVGRPAVEFRSPLLAVMTGKHHNIQGEDLTVKAVLRSPLKHRKMLRLSNTPSQACNTV